MNNSKLVIFALLCLSISSVFSQNMESDAIIFGTNNNEGSARHVAVGGAMSAIGGDVTSMSYNPAGIGIYKSSVIVLTPSLEINKSNAVFNASSSQQINTKVNFSNLGAVFSIKNKKFGIVENFNFGFAMNTLNSFNQKNRTVQKTNNSITSQWLNEAKDVNGNQDNGFSNDNTSFETIGAYNTWLVNFDNSDSSYSSPIVGSVLQNSITIKEGSKREYALSFGTNLLNKVYLGAALSIPYIKYTSETSFSENDYSKVNVGFQSFEMIQSYDNSGLGINLKVGVIYKPINFLRLSVGIQTPTRYSMEEKYTTDFVSSFDTANYEFNSDLGNFSYTFITPWRTNAGFALVSKKLGFVSFGYELVDYTSTHFDLADDYIDLESTLNDNLKDKYQIAHNFKVGIESKIKKFRIRGGYAMQTSPLKSSYREGDYDFSRHQFSGGFGFLWKRVSLDATYRYTMSKEYELSFDGQNGIVKDTDTQLLLFTVGFKLSK
jgi:hypothetical protein